MADIQKETFEIPVEIAHNAMMLHTEGGSGEHEIDGKKLTYRIISNCGMGGMELCVQVQWDGAKDWKMYAVRGKDLLNVVVPHFIEQSKTERDET